MEATSNPFLEPPSQIESGAEVKDPDNLDDLFEGSLSPLLEPPEENLLSTLRAQLTDIVYQLVDSSTTSPISKEQRDNLETQRLALLSQICRLEEQEERDKMAGMKVDTSRDNCLGLVVPASPKPRYSASTFAYDAGYGEHKRRRRGQLSRAEEARIRAEEEAMDLAGDTEVLPLDADVDEIASHTGESNEHQEQKHKKTKRKNKKRKRELTEEEKEMERRGWYIDERFVEDEEGKWVRASEVLKKQRKEKKRLRKLGLVGKPEKKKGRKRKGDDVVIDDDDEHEQHVDEVDEAEDVAEVTREIGEGDFELIDPDDDAAAMKNEKTELDTKTKDSKKGSGNSSTKVSGTFKGSDAKKTNNKSKTKGKSKSEMSLFERWAKELKAPFAGAAARFM